MLFAFKAYRDSGVVETGVIDASSPSDAHELLRKRGLTPVTVDRGAAKPKHWLTRDITFGRQGLSDAELARLSETLGALLGSGMSLRDAFGFLAETAATTKAQSRFARIGDAITSGVAPAEALAREDPIFPAEFCRLIAIGDQANTLTDVLQRASTTYAKRAAAKAQIQTALVYPAILVMAAFVLFGVLTFFLVPAIKPVFAGAGLEPNATLGLLFGVHGALTAAPGLMLGAAVGLLGSIAILALSGAGRGVGRAVLSRIPIARRLTRLRSYSMAARGLSMVMSAGATLQDGLRSLSEMQDRTTATVFTQAQDAVEKGRPVSSVLGMPATPPVFAQFVRIAETSNRWVELMASAADLLDAEADRLQARLMQVLTPALTIGIGLTMGFVMISIVTALLGLNDALIP